MAFLLFVFVSKSTAQVIDDENGKTYYYYDSLTHKKVKEIFHHKQVVQILPDKKHYGEYIDSTTRVKSGPYSRYFEDGNLECTGYYNNEKRDSVWKYYNAKGTLLKTELYRFGRLVK